MPEQFDPNSNPSPTEALGRIVEALENLAESADIIAGVAENLEDSLIEFPDDKSFTLRNFLLEYRERAAAADGEEEESEEEGT